MEVATILFNQVTKEHVQKKACKHLKIQITMYYVQQTSLVINHLKGASPLESFLS